MKRKQNAISLAVAAVLAIHFSAQAIAVEDSKVHFTKDMHVNITTVMGNHFTPYDALINKPLAQLIEVPAYQAVERQVKKADSFFETAMKAQDRIQYYMALVKQTFNGSTDEETGQCQSSKLARLFSF
ncbi:hypothetical protein [Thalassotalea mangrovi]|uniref:Uncharacterized protein n=1 Tax=Thalassotalea mangrovi TaxID=2572245 RepID=A0A4U1B3V2_9GAMM|nr:hypothetical protein [Thalassotalea mangrovi]TKB44699.1 hypothetical protein E8M12_11230 [Thalassotalea mangrovi]